MNRDIPLVCVVIVGFLFIGPNFFPIPIANAQVELKLENNLQIGHSIREPHPAILNSGLYSATVYDSQIFGEVLNNFTYPISSVEIYAAVKNSSGDTVITSNGFTKDFYLKPGQKSGFWILIHKVVPLDSNYTLVSTFERAYTAKAEGLKIDIKLMSLNPVKVVGTVTNLGKEKTNNVGVNGIFYDNLHKVVDAEQAFVNIYTGLAPGEKGSFVLQTMIENDQMEKIRTVALTAESTEYVMIPSNNNSEIISK